MGKACLKFHHPTTDGNGSAIKLELFYQNDKTDGFIRMIFANQSEDNFDFNIGICCDLKSSDVMNIISVLNGADKLHPNGKPLALANNTFFAMKRDGDGIILAAIRKGLSVNMESKIKLCKYEANGMKTALEQSLFFLSFIKGVNP